MRSVRTASILCALIAACVARADDRPATATGVAPLVSSLGPRLQRAVKEGELERLIGERVLLREDEGEALVLRVTRIGVGHGGQSIAADRLRCEAVLVVLGGMRAERTGLGTELDLATGATRTLAGEVLRGQERHDITGTVEAGQAAVQVRSRRRGGAVDEQTAGGAWPEDALVWSAVLALAPLLHDPAIPERTGVRIAYPVATGASDLLGSAAHTLVRVDGPPRTLRLEGADPDAPQVITLAADGAVERIEVPGAGVYSRIDRAAAEKLPGVLAAPTAR